jgi:hypothetical protein
MILKFFLTVLLSSAAWGQAAVTKQLTIEEAVARAQKFPSVEASQEQPIMNRNTRFGVSRFEHWPERRE